MTYSTIKGIVAVFAFTAALIGAAYYDGQVRRDCKIVYETSFNGLYIIKNEICYTRIGLAHDRKELDRRAMFEAF